MQSHVNPKEHGIRIVFILRRETQFGRCHGELDKGNFVP